MIQSSIRRAVVLGAMLLAVAGGGTRLAAQPKSGSADAVVLEVGREKITLGQIADAYKKNANRGGKSFYDLDRDSAMAFVNLYANYRLKVQAALDAGVDKRPEVVEDLRLNRLQLAVPPSPGIGYLVERKVVDPAVERIFKRREDELLLALIYVSMRANDPTDTLRAYNKALSILKLMRAGNDFTIMARDSSDDPSTKDVGGRLPSYITAGMILTAIEDAAYETRPGDVYPGLVHVPGGYVVLKVLDRSPRYKLRGAHILINAESDSSTIFKGTRRPKAEAVLARIKNGEDFAKVAKEVSDDRISGENGGDFLSWYTRSLGFEVKNARLDAEVESALFKLKDGQISDSLVRTRFGNHILKRLESRRPTFDEEKETIRQIYKQRLIGDDRAAYVRSVVEKNGLKIEQNTFNEVLAAVRQGGTTADTAWAAGIGAGLRNSRLFSYAGTNYTVGAWIDSLKARPDLRATPLTRAGAQGSIYTLFEHSAMVAEAATLEKEYPEFAELMREFRDGILIFNLEDEVIWKKLNEGYDEARGRAFFQQNQAKYKSDPELGLTEIFLYKEEDAREVYQQALKGGTPFETMATQLTQRKDFRDRGGKWDQASAKNADIVKQVLDRSPNPRQGEILQPFAYQGGWSIIRVDAVSASAPMTYEEAKSQVQGDYLDYVQKQLSEEWLAALRVKHGVKVNDKVLKNALAAN